LKKINNIPSHHFIFTYTLFKTYVNIYILLKHTSKYLNCLKFCIHDHQHNMRWFNGWINWFNLSFTKKYWRCKHAKFNMWCQVWTT